MGKKLVASTVVPCRICKNNISEIAKTCIHCGIDSPGVDSECPECGSINYTWRTTGFSIGRAVGGSILLGPLGLAAGMVGYNDVECICNKCGQGWLPFGMVGGGLSKTKKYRR